jgi:hypothetical protein
MIPTLILRTQANRETSHHMSPNVRSVPDVACGLLTDFFWLVIRQTGRASIFLHDPFPFFYWVLCSLQREICGSAKPERWLQCPV